MMPGQRIKLATKVQKWLTQLICLEKERIILSCSRNLRHY